jgi:indole-3-glycerol phosphate synthase
LDEIIRHKRQELRGRWRDSDMPGLRAKAKAAPACKDFLGALKEQAGEAIVAEVKKAAPSAGELSPQVNAADQARKYVRGGATALSVLTDSRYFGGSLQDLKAVRAKVDLPILQKDFIVDPRQIMEAKICGADAILLIVKALSDEEFASLYSLAGRLGLTALVEVNTADELERALQVNPKIIGVNNRNLATLEISMGTTARLGSLLPKDCLLLSASGIKAPAEIKNLQKDGAEAFLIGTSLMKAKNPAQALFKMKTALKTNPVE